MEEHPNKFEWTLLIIFVLSAIGIFYYRVITPISEINQLATVLLSVFEILLALYVGYFLQRLDSIRQSRESLKKYGFLAYRRIMDIKKSINRLFNEIARINKYLPEDRGNEVKILHSILEGTFDTVESSVLDWVDIIGEEIRKKERVDVIQEELIKSRAGIDLSTEDKENIERLRSELKTISSELPLSLMSNSLSQQIESTKQTFYMSYFETNANRNGYIELYIKSFADTSQVDIEKMLDGQPFIFSFDVEGTEIISCFVLDKAGIAIGTIENPVVPYDKKPYINILGDVLRFLGTRRPDKSTHAFQIENLKYVGATYDGLIIMQLPTGTLGGGFGAWG